MTGKKCAGLTDTLEMNTPVKTVQKIYVTNRKEWREWLVENHKKQNEIWLIFYKKHTGKSRIPYDDAVEEALCFGWIDSIVKRVDDEKYIQKFSPRKAKSIWSDANKKRIKKMIDKGLMTESGLEKVREAKRNGSWDDSSPIYDSKQIPPALAAALSTNKMAHEFYLNLAPTYRKQYNWWIVSAKRQETRSKRILEAVKLLENHKKLGMK